MIDFFSLVSSVELYILYTLLLYFSLFLPYSFPILLYHSLPLPFLALFLELQGKELTKLKITIKSTIYPISAHNLRKATCVQRITKRRSEKLGKV